MHHARKPLVALVGCALMASAIAQTVPPGKLFSSPLLNVHSPNDEGWQMVGGGGQILAFFKQGRASNESYVAQVNLFALPPTQDSDELVALIQKGIDADSPPERFTTIEQKVEYTDQRGYACVRFSGLTEDKNARTGIFSREHLKLQIQSLYCRHPLHAHMGFMIGFSHRGAETDSGLPAKAAAFMDGVQVPAPPPAAASSP